MAKEIGLKINITSQGQEKVITNLNDLEKELQSLDNTLKTLDFGSKEFEETARNIQTLRSRLEDVDKATEGFGVEKRLQAIAATTNILTGSFQALSGVISTLTTDEDTLKSVQEAEAKALNVLNIALGVRAIQEGLLESRVLARTAIEKLSIKTSQTYIATAKGISAVLKTIGIDAGVASVGVRALTASLAALGIPLLIIGITTLIDKFSELNFTASGIKSAEKAYEDFNDELERTRDLIDARVEALEVEGDTLAALQERQRALNEEQEDRNDLEIRLIRERQEARNQENKEEEKRLDDLIQKNLVARIRIASNLKRVEKEITKFNQDEEKKRTDEIEKQNKKRLENQQKALAKRLEQQKKYLEELKTLVSDEIEVQAEVLEKVQEIIDKQEDLIQQRTEFATNESEKLTKEINKLFFDVIPTAEDAKLLKDFYISIFRNINEAIDKELIELPKGGIKSFEELIALYNKAGLALRDPLFRNGFTPVKPDQIKITEEGRKALFNFFNTISRFQDVLSGNEYKDLITKSILGGNPEERLKQTNQFLRDLIDEGVKQLTDETLLQGEAERNLSKFITERLGLQKQTGAVGELNIAKQTAYNERLEIFTQLLVDLAKKEGDVVAQSNKVADALTEQNLKATENEATLKRFGVVVGEINGKSFLFVDNIKKGLSDIEITNLTKLLADSFSTSEEAFTGFLNNIINDTEGLRTKLLEVLSPQQLQNLLAEGAKGLSNITFESEEQLQNLINTLGQYNIVLNDVLITGEENGEKLGVGYSTFNDIIKELIGNLKKLQVENKNATETSESFLDSLTDVANKVVEVFNNISGRISSIVQRNNELLFEQLARQEEQSLALAGDATEREREEQLKLQKEFAKKRFDLEKKARIQELQFTLANSIASGAQAVIQALGLAAPPPIPQLYAGLIAGLTGIEIATINSQIRSAESSTFIGRRGGLIQGATHEGGGVPALLEGGEFVMSRPAVDRFGDIVGQMNQSVGGRGLQIDDSRIVQAISSQNTTKTPIKTYVVYQDIKDTDKLNNRIQKLSRL